MADSAPLNNRSRANETKLEPSTQLSRAIRPKQAFRPTVTPNLPEKALWCRIPLSWFLERFSGRVSYPPRLLGATSRVGRIGCGSRQLEAERQVRIADLMAIARDVLEPLGYEVLEVQTGGAGRVSTVVVRMDRLDEQPVAVTDLERASRVLGLEFDRLDPIQGEYRLELESPGAKRPLLRARHFERMVGLKVKVKVPGVGGTVGIIKEVTPETVTLETDGGKLESFNLAGIQANLMEFPDKHR